MLDNHINEEPIRVLHMIGSLNIGGSQAMIKSLYNNIDRNKIQFDFIIDHPNELEFASGLREMGAKIYTMPAFKGFNFFALRKAWKTFFIKHPEYRILHSHVRSYASLYLPIAKKYGIKTIIHSHSTSNGKGLKAIIKKLLQYPLRYQADYFFACSKEAGEWLFGRKRTSDSAFNIVKNGIDVKKYIFNLEKRDEYRKKLNVEGKKVYIHVGRFQKAKNHRFLLETFKEIYLEQSNSILILVGDGELRDEIKKYIDELNLNELVILLGNREDIGELLQMADCFLFPSLWEGLGIAAVEAQAAGLPTICSDTIPNEVAITDLCSFVTLNDRTRWVEVALKESQKARKDNSQLITDAGYDIFYTAKWLSSFYEKLHVNMKS